MKISDFVYGLIVPILDNQEKDKSLNPMIRKILIQKGNTNHKEHGIVEGKEACISYILEKTVRGR